VSLKEGMGNEEMASLSMVQNHRIAARKGVREGIDYLPTVYGKDESWT